MGLFYRCHYLVIELSRVLMRSSMYMYLIISLINEDIYIAIYPFSNYFGLNGIGVPNIVT